MTRLRILNGNALKFLAAFLMVVDHIGFMFFPDILIFRIIGRLSMPMFALALSEGCRYTKNKTRHFLLLFALALLCQTVYYFFDDGSLYMCILVTFSIAVLNIYAMQNFKKRLFDGSPVSKQAGAFLLFIGAVVGTYFLCNFCSPVIIDYGFWGCMTPVLASLFDFRNIDAPKSLKRLDCLPLRVLCLWLGLLFLAFDWLEITLLPFWALLSLPILLLYNGEKGKMKTKYFFYLFYPLHLVLLEGIYMWVYLF